MARRKKGKKNRISIDFDGFDEMAERIDKLAGLAGLQKAVEKGLKASKDYVNAEAEKAMQKSKLPAKGKYSKGDTLQGLDRNTAVDWKDGGTYATLKIGFDLSQNITSIFLMYGTPRMAPDKALYNAFYSAKTKRKVKEVQKEVVTEYLNEIMRG